MVNQKEHVSAIHKFIKENLLRGEQDQSVFNITEEKTYASLKLFTEFRQSSSSNFKTMATGVKTLEIQPCGQAECSKYRRPHSAEDCWVLNPEKKPIFNPKQKSPISPNDSTSSKKNPKGLARAGQGKNGKRQGGKDESRAKKELKRIKTYLTKNEVFDGNQRRRP